MKHTKLFLTLILTAFTIFLTSCGDDSSENTVPGNYPDIDIKQGSIFNYTFDTLDANGNPTRLTGVTSHDSVWSQRTYNGQTATPIYSRTDSVGNITYDTVYVRYDASAGKFYQWGIVHFLDPTQAGTWDLVADFSVSTGTEWQVTEFDMLLSGFTIHVKLKAKVAETTSFQTTGTSQTIQCYRSEIRGELSYASLPIGNIYFDYYIGYTNGSNPAGLVRQRLRHINITVGITQLVNSPGVDRVCSTYSIP